MTDADPDPVLDLVNEFLDRLHRGEKPTIQEYCAAHPDLADDIRELFPALITMDDLHPATGEGEVAKAEIDLPDQIGDYRIIGEIGRGGMGVVYEAEQESLGRRVALKVLPNTLRSQSASIRFQREARSAARMHHTNIVPVFEVGQDGDCIFYAMQLIKGQGLDLVIDGLREADAGSGSTLNTNSAITKEQLLSQPVSAGSSTSGLHVSHSHTSGSTRNTFYRSAAKIGLQTAEAMAFAHARGVIHRDIKPSNLLLDTEGVVWVTDFGLAKSDEDDATLTQSGDYLGTLRYMSPERFRGQCDATADIYALGMTLYELVLHQPAFASADRMKLIYTINQVEPASPRSLDPNIPRDLETIILKAIDKRPESRYSSAKAMAMDLQRFINDEPIEARRLSSFEQLNRWARRNRGLAAAISGIAVLLVAMVIGATWAAIRQSELRVNSQTSEGLAKIAQGRAEQAQQKAEEALGQAEESRRAEEMAREIAESARANMDDARTKSEELEKQADQRLRQETRKSYHSELNLAGGLMGVPGGRGKIKQIVERWDRDADRQQLNGWEWYLLNETTRSDGVAVEGVRDCRSAEWSHDGKWIAVARGAEVLIVDASSGEPVGEPMSGHTGPINAIAWHQDDTYVASVADDSTARFWNVETREEMRDKEGPFEGRATRVAWSPSGERVAFSVDNKGIFIVERFGTEESEPLLLPNSPGYVRHLMWSPDETHLAEGTWFQNTMSLYDVENRKPVGESLRATRVVWNNGHEISALIHATAPGRIDVFDGVSDLRTQTLSGHTQWARSAELSPDGTSLVSGGPDRKIYIWDLENGRIRRTFVEHTDGLTVVRFSPDGKRVVSVSNDSVRIWDTAQPEKTILDNSGDLASNEGVRELRVTGLTWHPAENVLASSSYDSNARIWDVAEQRVTHRYPAMSYSVAWSPDGSNLAIGAAPEMLIVNPKSGKVPFVAPAGNGVSWSADGSMISAAIGDSNQRHKVRVYAYPSLEQKFEWPGQPECSAWHPHDPAILAFAGLPHTLIVQNGKIVHKLPAHSARVRRIRWSPDGRLLATCSDDATIMIHDLESGEHRVLDGHTSAVWAIDWHPNGRRLASAGTDGTIRIWETAGWRETLTLNGGDTAVSAAAWSPDGRRLATGNQLGQIMVWDAGPDFPILSEPPTKTSLPPASKMVDSDTEPPPVVDSKPVESEIGRMLSSDEWEWTEPQRLSINSEANEYEPWVAPDELTLLFCSDRGGGTGGFDLYVSRRTSKYEPWNPPQALTELNSDSHDEAPHMSADGLRLWFSSNRNEDERDLWFADRTSTTANWSAPQLFSDEVNLRFDADIEPTVSDDGCTLVFCSTREPKHGIFDLWMSTRPSTEAEWGSPVHLNRSINSDDWQGSPCLLGDGFGSVLVFHSYSDCLCSIRNSGNALFEETRSIDPDGTLGLVYSPFLTADGRTLYYRRHDALIGTFDLWVSHRVRKDGVGLLTE